MKATIWFGALAAAGLSGLCFAQGVDDMKLRHEEVLRKSLLEGNGATCMVTEGNFADMVTEGNFADMVTEGNFADMVTQGNFGSPMGLALRQMQEIESSKSLPSPQ